MCSRLFARLARLTCAVWAALLLASCGGGGGGDAGDSTGPLLPVRDYFPLNQGDRWVYQASDDFGSGTMLLRVAGTRAVAGQTGVVMQANDDPQADAVYLPGPDGLDQFPGTAADPITTAIGPVRLMRYPLRQGDRFVQVDKRIDSGIDFDGDGRNEQAAVRSIVDVVGLESVDTPLGSMADSLHLHTVLTVTITVASIPVTITVTTTSDDWLTPDIGLVKNRTVITDPNGTYTWTQLLSTYRVGTRHSETVAPTVESVGPPDGTTWGSVANLDARFSEAMDLPSLVAGFTVSDAGGAPVAGRVQVDGRIAYFLPDAPLPGGHYAARLAASVEDLAGNTLGSDRNWSFDIDTGLPSVVSTNPVNGAVDVPLDQSIKITFSETVAPASLDGKFIFSSDFGGSVPFTLSSDGAVVTLAPDAPLQRDQQYFVVVLPGVSDLHGNAMGHQVQIGFHTMPGRFSAPVLLSPGFAPDSMAGTAIGDVNGDGRADVVMGAPEDPAAFDHHRLLIWLQQADGSRAAPVAVRTQSICFPTSIVIADVDRDGRNDVAVGESGCGIEIFRQSAGGALQSQAFIASAQSDKLRLADFNGDGRLDMVAIGQRDSAARLWLQDVGGSMQPAGAPVVQTGAFPGLAVGDLNGDGRTDFVVHDVNRADASVGVVLQQASGNFAAPTYLEGIPAVSPAGVAVGDLNGDGRQDIVVTMGGNSPTFIGVYYQDANGQMAAPVLLPSYDIPTQVVVADINNDGRADVVVGHSGWVSVGVYLQQADGSLAAEARYRAPYGSFYADNMAVGDINGDGRNDIVTDGHVLLQNQVPVQSQSVRTLRPRRPDAAALLRSTLKSFRH